MIKNRLLKLFVVLLASITG